MKWRLALEHNPVLDAMRAQEFGASALEETQVRGVIDDAGKIGVLVIDADDDFVFATDFSCFYLLLTKIY